jgi:hypothetical protein
MYNLIGKICPPPFLINVGMHNLYHQHISPHLFTAASGSLFHDGREEQTVLLPQAWFSAVQCASCSTVQSNGQFEFCCSFCRLQCLSINALAGK